MILQRDNTAKKVQQQQYRQELYNSIIEKQAPKNRSRVITSQPSNQKFSLIKNIEDQQQRRKNKQKQYYAELQKQRLQEIQFKKKKQQQEKRRQLEQDLKIQKQNQMLRKRYQEQKKKQSKKQDQANQRAKQMGQQLIKKQQQKVQRKQRIRLQARQPQVHVQQQIQLQRGSKQTNNYPHDSIDQIQFYQKQPQQQTNINMSRFRDELPVTFTYPTRIENQDFNFPQRRILSNNHNYYRELQFQKRKFQEQANQFRQLNRYIIAQRSNFTKRNFQGLESLKQLERLLDDQTNNIKREYSGGNFKGDYFNGYRSKTQNSGSYGY